MASAPQVSRATGCMRRLDRAGRWIGRHWLALMNLFWGGYVGLALLAPVLMLLGWAGPAKAIYLLYRPACHQRPERSFFLGGPQGSYSAEDLQAAGVDVDPLARAIGNAQTGFKVAMCERDTALYGAVAATGLAYAVFRKRMRRIRLPLWAGLLFVAPMAVDGTLQLLGFYESTWLLRSLTGVLFGIGPVLLAYPLLDESLGDAATPRGSVAARQRPIGGRPTDHGTIG